LDTGGAWSEKVALRTDQLAVLPDDVPETLAAALPVAGMTGLRILGLGGRELSGLTVFVTGGVGTGRF